MPIFTKHDFMSNFNASLSSGDSDFTTDMLVNEISDLVIYNVTALVSMMNKVGVKATENDTDETLIDKILSNINTNSQLVKGLAFLLADNNDLINKKGISKDAAKQTVDTIAGGISTLSNQIGAKISLKMAVKKDIINQIKSKAAAKGDYTRTIENPKSKSNAKRNFWLISLGVIVVVGGIIVWRRYYPSTPDISEPLFVPPTPIATPTPTPIAAAPVIATPTTPPPIPAA